MQENNTILDTIIADTRVSLEEKKKEIPLESLRQQVGKRATNLRDFRAALAKPGKLRVMAEIKKTSPSSGLIRPDFDPYKIASQYEHSGLVDAISIITEPIHFQGNPNWIHELRASTTIPLFRKDFIFDEYQVYESYLMEADALLLIAGALEEPQLRTLIGCTQTLGMEALVETRTAEEIATAVRAGANIIGINARNLRSFTLDKDLFPALAHNIPEGKIKVAESGLQNRDDMLRVKQAGANAVLVGTSIMNSGDISRTLKELFDKI